MLLTNTVCGSLPLHLLCHTGHLQCWAFLVECIAYRKVTALQGIHLALNIVYNSWSLLVSHRASSGAQEDFLHTQKTHATKKILSVWHHKAEVAAAN